MMAKEKLEKQRLNPNDHKKEDNVANVIRNGTLIATAVGFIVKCAINIIKNNSKKKS